MMDVAFWQSEQTVAEIRQRFRHLASERLPLHWLDGWLLFVLKKEPIHFITQANDRLSLDEMTLLKEGLDRLAVGEPLAYLTGRQGFWRHDFLVNEQTLIPRADTERLVEVALDLAKAWPVGSLLDLGTGSGCIGLSLAKELPAWQAVLVDASVGALEVACQNAAALAADNARCLHSHWYDEVVGQFELIVSNPPYIDPNDAHLANLTAEPITALVADEAGLTDIQAIIGGAPKHLVSGGYLLIEHGYDQGEAVAKLFGAAGFEQIATIKDYGNNDRLTLGRWP